jgi:hypothetical protein
MKTKITSIYLKDEVVKQFLKESVCPNLSRSADEEDALGASFNAYRNAVRASEFGLTLYGESHFGKFKALIDVSTGNLFLWKNIE